MYGAILGDMIGSPFEFDRGKKTKDFELFSSDSRFTDDTVMTIAVADALMHAGKSADEGRVCEAVVSSMQHWGRKYPNAGYGGKFRIWLKSNEPKPYGSIGNGYRHDSIIGESGITAEKLKFLCLLSAVKLKG